MNKQKFIAATITTLVLFAIVRFFSPQQESPLQKEGRVGEEAEQAFEEEPGEVETFEKKTKKRAGENLKKEKPRLAPKVSKALMVEKEQGSEMVSFFSKKSEFVYFKIKDGLALVGGDIVIGELSEEQKESAQFGGKLLKDKPKQSKLWPSAEIPFGFNEGFPEALRENVLEAIAYYNVETAVNFVQVDADYDEDVVVFQLREGAPCSSYLGRVGGLQPIYLNKACSKQDVIHELMHALGFVHEQQREGRDQHIEILWPNIQADYQYNFSILPDSLVHQYEGSVFNLSLTSVMMYHDEAFSKDNKKTMVGLRGSKIEPVNSGLANIDKERIELLYGG